MASLSRTAVNGFGGLYPIVGSLGAKLNPEGWKGGKEPIESSLDQKAVHIQLGRRPG
jgi:hypothetical protein